MALAMARPWKHPKTGVYWFRRQVPGLLKPIVGKSEVVFSLRTKDPAEAKRLHAEALTRVEQQWSNLQKPPRILSEREAHELAQPVFQRFINFYRDNPSEQKTWRSDLFEKLWGVPDLSHIDVTRLDYETPAIRNMEKLCSDSALWIATERGLRLDDISQRRLIVAVGHAMQRAALSLQAATGGWFQSRDSLGNLEHPVNPSPVLFDDLLRGWIAEKHPAQKTIYTWTKVCHTFVEFVGHGDASRVTPDDFIRWKEFSSRRV